MSSLKNKLIVAVVSGLIVQGIIIYFKDVTKNKNEGIDNA